MMCCDHVCVVKKKKRKNSFIPVQKNDKIANLKKLNQMDQK